MEDTTSASGPAMNLRPRRSVLSDISNKVIGSISNASKKALGAGSKKRKSSFVGSDVDTKKRSSSSSDSQNNVVEKANPLATTKSKELSTTTSQTVSSNEETKGINKINRTFAIYTKGSDPALCLEYIDEIYELFNENEKKYTAGNYMNLKQTDINFKMRSILIDWLVEVHYKFKLFTSTLFLCVNILDRYLEQVPIQRSKLQLVGVTSLFIACKFEEVYPPEVRECVYITDYAYDREEVLKMETNILTTLDWTILVPTSYHFLTRYLTCIRCSQRTRNVAFYYAERNLQEPEFLCSTPKLYAAAAVYAALMQQSTQYPNIKRTASAWPTALKDESGLREEEIREYAINMTRHVSEEPVTTSKRKLVAAKKKYQSEKYDFIADLALPKWD